MQENFPEYTVNNERRQPGTQSNNNSTAVASATNNLLLTTANTDTAINDDDDGNNMERSRNRKRGTLRIRYVVKYHTFRKHKFISGLDNLLNV